jgi:hypothetical protein
VLMVSSRACGVVNWIIGGSSGLMDIIVGLVSTEATASEAGDPWSDGVMGSRFMIGCGWDVECGNVKSPQLGGILLGRVT